MAAWAAAGCVAACGPASRSALVAPPFETSFEWAELRFSVSVLPSPADRLRLRAEIENLAARFRSVHTPVCFPWMRAYREGRLAWDQREGGACEGMSPLVEIPPNGEEVWHGTLSADRILGDSLPAGEYGLALYVPRADRPGQPPRAPMELPLGRVRLEPREDGRARPEPREDRDRRMRPDDGRARASPDVSRT